MVQFRRLHAWFGSLHSRSVHSEQPRSTDDRIHLSNYSRLHEFGMYIGFANSGNVETQSLTNQKTWNLKTLEDHPCTSALESSPPGGETPGLMSSECLMLREFFASKTRVVYLSSVVHHVCRGKWRSKKTERNTFLEIHACFQCFFAIPTLQYGVSNFLVTSHTCFFGAFPPQPSRTVLWTIFDQACEDYNWGSWNLSMATSWFDLSINRTRSQGRSG